MSTTWASQRRARLKNFVTQRPTAPHSSLTSVFYCHLEPHLASNDITFTAVSTHAQKGNSGGMYGGRIHCSRQLNINRLVILLNMLKIAERQHDLNDNVPNAEPFTTYVCMYLCNTDKGMDGFLKISFVELRRINS